MANRNYNKTKNPNIPIEPRRTVYSFRLSDAEFNRVLEMMRYYNILDFSKTLKMCLDNQYERMTEEQHAKNS